MTTMPIFQWVGTFMSAYQCIYQYSHTSLSPIKTNFKTQGIFKYTSKKKMKKINNFINYTFKPKLRT